MLQNIILSYEEQDNELDQIAIETLSIIDSTPLLEIPAFVEKLPFYNPRLIIQLFSYIYKNLQLKELNPHDFEKLFVLYNSTKKERIKYDPNYNNRSLFYAASHLGTKASQYNETMPRVYFDKTEEDFLLINFFLNSDEQKIDLIHKYETYNNSYVYAEVMVNALFSDIFDNISMLKVFAKLAYENTPESENLNFKKFGNVRIGYKKRKSCKELNENINYKYYVSEYDNMLYSYERQLTLDAFIETELHDQQKKDIYFHYFPKKTEDQNPIKFSLDICGSEFKNIKKHIQNKGKHYFVKNNARIIHKALIKNNVKLLNYLFSNIPDMLKLKISNTDEYRLSYSIFNFIEHNIKQGNLKNIILLNKHINIMDILYNKSEIILPLAIEYGNPTILQFFVKHKFDIFNPKYSYQIFLNQREKDLFLNFKYIFDTMNDKEKSEYLRYVQNHFDDEIKKKKNKFTPPDSVFDYLIKGFIYDNEIKDHNLKKLNLGKSTHIFTLLENSESYDEKMQDYIIKYFISAQSNLQNQGNVDVFNLIQEKGFKLQESHYLQILNFIESKYFIKYVFKNKKMYPDNEEDFLSFIDKVSSGFTRSVIYYLAFKKENNILYNKAVGILLNKLHYYIDDEKNRNKVHSSTLLAFINDMSIELFDDKNIEYIFPGDKERNAYLSSKYQTLKINNEIAQINCQTLPISSGGKNKKRI